MCGGGEGRPPLSAAVNEQPGLAAGHLAASIGPYFLYFVAEDHFQLLAPDADCPQAWLRYHLPAGDWYTEWSGDGDYLIVHFTR